MGLHRRNNKLARVRQNLQRNIIMVRLAVVIAKKMKHYLTYCAIVSCAYVVIAIPAVGRYLYTNHVDWTCRR